MSKELIISTIYDHRTLYSKRAKQQMCDFIAIDLTYDMIATQLMQLIMQ